MPSTTSTGKTRSDSSAEVLIPVDSLGFPKDSVLPHFAHAALTAHSIGNHAAPERRAAKIVGKGSGKGDEIVARLSRK